MLAKKFRLPAQSVIGKKGQVIRGRYTVTKIFPGAVAHGRLAVVVSKKVAPKAHDRNRLKRLAYDVISKPNDQLPAPTDILVTLLPSVTDETSERGMIKELKSILKSANNE